MVNRQVFTKFLLARCTVYKRVVNRQVFTKNLSPRCTVYKRVVNAQMRTVSPIRPYSRRDHPCLRIHHPFVNCASRRQVLGENLAIHHPFVNCASRRTHTYSHTESTTHLSGVHHPFVAIVTLPPPFCRVLRHTSQTQKWAATHKRMRWWHDLGQKPF